MSRSSTTTSPAIAPIANSAWPGTPSLRTGTTSSSAPSAEGNLECDRHSAARKREDDDVVASEAPQPVREHAARRATIVNGTSMARATAMVVPARSFFGYRRTRSCEALHDLLPRLSRLSRPFVKRAPLPSEREDGAPRPSSPTTSS
jgi:hypothetical protein